METNQRVVVTKRMLREGLLRLLETKELDKISITELCRESGVNRSTFYRYYTLPKDILMEMQDTLLEKIYDHIPESLSAGDVERFLNYLLKNVEMIRLFLQYLSEIEWIDIFNHVYHNIRDKKFNKAFQGLDEDSSRLLFAYLTGGAYFVIRQWIMEDIPKSPKEVTNVILSILGGEKAS